MKDNVLLLLGIGCVGIMLGYMVGGSSSPVISIAVPTIFGLVITALGLMKAPQPSKNLLKFLRSYGADASSIPEIKDFRNRNQLAPNLIGLTLIIFSCTFFIAAYYGSESRIKNHSELDAALEFPWSDNTTKPLTINSALGWIALQQRLYEIGYDHARIKELYEIQVKEWNAIGLNSNNTRKKEIKESSTLKENFSDAVPYSQEGMGLSNFMEESEKFIEFKRKWKKGNGYPFAFELPDPLQINPNILNFDTNT